MSGSEDDDLKALRAASWALKELKSAFTQSEWQVNNGPDENGKHAKQPIDYDKICDLLNVFQEDPQLLDPHLKDFVTPVVQSFTQSLSQHDHNQLSDLSKVIYTFCKVRGAKVITRFFENEPQHLQTILSLLDEARAAQQSVVESSDLAVGTKYAAEDATDTKTSISWETRYVLLLWVAHLMLTPFDLTLVSARASTETLVNAGLPHDLPEVAVMSLRICKSYLRTASGDQGAAATALVKLALRPDMNRVGLLDYVLRESMGCFQDDTADLQLLNGQLMLLNGILSSANADDIQAYVLGIYNLIHGIFYQNTSRHTQLQASAVSKKLAIKILRNITVQVLQHEKMTSSSTHRIATHMLHELGVLEDVIDFLLRSLADRDTQVRYAASKALSIITTKLEPAMAEEVVEAVLGSLNENVFIDDKGERNISAVSPVRWHGLTLTLSHMLFRRSPSPEQLPDVLQALYSTLAFEQRSATGNSLGSNVRDAANYGLWSLARRYSTKELQEVKFTNQQSTLQGQSALQVTACHLLIAACLDPAGNIRRGSSAALQELIGRHPDTIIDGIALVQIVDYHAVGLRERAMVEVAGQAAKLSKLYLSVLLDNLLDWRGVRAPDTASREHAGKSIGRLVNLRKVQEIELFVEDITSKLKNISPREVEWRHGLILALAAVLEQYEQSFASSDVQPSHDELRMLSKLSRFWVLFGTVISISSKDLSTPSMKSELTISAILRLVSAIALCQLLSERFGAEIEDLDMQPITQTITICLAGRSTEAMEHLPSACQKIFMVLPPAIRANTAKYWLEILRSTPRGPKIFGFLLAQASILNSLRSSETELETTVDLKSSIMDTIIKASNAPDIETRVIAIRSLRLTLPSRSSDTSNPDPQLLEALERALNDYTINERGDVGSLARFQALLVIEQVWLLGGATEAEQILSNLPCLTIVQRLALERLDKVRLQAAKCLISLGSRYHVLQEALTDTSTYEYLMGVGRSMLQHAAQMTDTRSRDVALQEFLIGFASSTGAGAESLMEISRETLHDLLQNLPTSAKDSSALPALGTALITLLTATISSNNDRVLLPLLEMTNFLLDAHILQTLITSAPATIEPLTLLSLTQKAHFKSTSLPKLLSCIHIYRHLATIHEVKKETFKKLISMLIHPYPKVREAVAEVLWVCTEDQALLDVNWLETVTCTTKQVVERMKTKYVI